MRKIDNKYSLVVEIGRGRTPQIMEDCKRDALDDIPNKSHEKPENQDFLGVFAYTVGISV